MMDFLSNMMNVFQVSLMLPVMILLTILEFVTLVQVGDFISEYTKRHRNWSSLETHCKKIQYDLKNSDFSGASRT
ncbi:MAG: MotA/TolQ/ExbB proton channel family protein, partial [Methanosarcina sp.]|nr:MotA/TolQ/ExbB proton channel family protein [Methanosarcina sp.]